MGRGTIEVPVEQPLSLRVVAQEEFDPLDVLPRRIATCPHCDGTLWLPTQGAYRALAAERDAIRAEVAGLEQRTAGLQTVLHEVSNDRDRMREQVVGLRKALEWMLEAYRLTKRATKEEFAAEDLPAIAAAAGIPLEMLTREVADAPTE